MKLSAVLLMILPGAAMAQPLFEPRPIPDHAYSGGWEFFVGGGLAAFDCSGDGLPELYAAGGEAPAQLMRNQGNFVFTADTPEALALTGVTGAYPLDIDSDGVLDLAILRVGENYLMRGLGGCEFSQFEGLGFDGGDGWTTAFSATWEAGQSLPTLAFGNYVDRSDPDGPFEACDQSLLYRPEGDIYGAPIPLQPGFCTLSMLFSDWGRRGRADLRVSNDRHYYVRGGQEQMWAMQATPRLYSAEDGWNAFQLWGMGIASRDLDGDGLPEVYMTSMGDQRLQMLDPDADGPSYVDAPYSRGATAQRPYTGGDGRPSTGWHAAFGDVDSDGWDDLFVAKGNVEQMPGSAMDDPNNLLMGAADGIFREAGLQAGVAGMARARGAALVDMDGDGLLDLAVVNRGAAMELYRNITEVTGGWLQVDVFQDGANRFVVGAFVELRAGDRLWTQEITVGGGHAGGVAGPLHFGLGDVDMVELRVIWPDGVTGPWQRIEVDQRVTVRRDG
jgi:enediyne biosynthesis protein E4